MKKRGKTKETAMWTNLFKVNDYDFDTSVEELIAELERIYIAMSDEDSYVSENMQHNSRYIKSHPLYVVHCMTPMEMMNRVKNAAPKRPREEQIPLIEEYRELFLPLEGYEYMAALTVYLEHLKIEIELLNPNKLKWNKN